MIPRFGTGVIIETRSLPALARCYPRSFTFYVGDPFPRFSRTTARRRELRFGAHPTFVLVMLFDGGRITRAFEHQNNRARLDPDRILLRGSELSSL